MNIYIIRHGQTDENSRGIVQGWMDTVLNDRGKADAEAVAERIKHLVFQRCLSSDLQRCQQTAQRIANKAHASSSFPHIESFHALRERNLGKRQGLTVAEGLALAHHHKTSLQHLEGESHAEFTDRAIAFWRSLIDDDDDSMETNRDKRTDHNILLITHGGFINALAYILITKLGYSTGAKVKLQNKSRLGEVPNCSVTLINVHTRELVLFGDTTHQL